MKIVEFRDGERDVPDHVADMMRGLRTWEMTYEEAKSKSENRMVSQALEVAQKDLIDAHFRGMTDGTHR